MKGDHARYSHWDQPWVVFQWQASTRELAVVFPQWVFRKKASNRPSILIKDFTILHSVCSLGTGPSICSNRTSNTRHGWQGISFINKASGQDMCTDNTTTSNGQRTMSFTSSFEFHSSVKAKSSCWPEASSSHNQRLRMILGAHGPASMSWNVAS